jgi:hypothetical protein
MYNICNLLLVLGACTGNRKQSTPEPLSSKSLKHFIPLSHIIPGSGYRGENPTRGLSVFFCFLCPMNCPSFTATLFQPRILYHLVALKLKPWNLKTIRLHHVRVFIRTLNSNIFNSGGPYWKTYFLLNHLTVCIVNYLAAINVHLFIIYLKSSEEGIFLK